MIILLDPINIKTYIKFIKRIVLYISFISILMFLGCQQSDDSNKNNTSIKVKKIQNNSATKKKNKLKITQLNFNPKQSTVIKPFTEYKVKGSVIDMILHNNVLYVVTDKGSLVQYDLENDKQRLEVNFPLINRFGKEEQPTKLYSIDISPDEKKLLIISEGDQGKREIFIYQNNKLTKIFTAKKSMLIQKARFIDNNKVFLALLSNEVLLFDLNSKKTIYRHQINISPFSDFDLNQERSKAAICDESGNISLFDVKKSEIITIFKGIHVDRVFKLKYNNSVIIGGGQDRRISIYYEGKNRAKQINLDFLVYTVGLSPEAEVVGFSMNEFNDIGILKLNSSNQSFILKGHSANPNQILFNNDKTIITGGDDSKVLLWRIP